MRFFLALVFFVTPLVARPYSDFAPGCACRVGYFEFEVGLLAWKVSTPGFYLGMEGSEVENIRTRYGFGAVFAARYFTQDQCRYLALTWHHFDRLVERRTFETHNGQKLITPNGVPDVTGFREANLKFEYNALELVAGQRVVCLPCVTLDLFAGLAGARMLQRHGIHYLSTTQGDVPMRSRVIFEGLGLTGGASAEYQICCARWGTFDFVGKASVAYMLGERKRDSEPLPDGTKVQFQDITEWIPAFYAQGGVRYSYQYQAFLMMIEIGYGIRHYANAFLNNADPANTDDSFTKDFTLGGPYLSVRLRF